MEIDLTIAIAAPPEQVFAVYTDPHLVPRWRTAIAEITSLSGPMQQVGTTFETRYHGRTPSSRGQVVESEPPHRHTIAGRGVVAYSADVRFRAEAGGTIVTFALDVRPPGGRPGHLAARLFLRPKVDRETRAEFARLKALVEQEPA